jgi:hypothetical protein
MSSRIIYVLCYDDESEKKAITEFSQYPWARIYRIPVESQNHLFEGVMYQTELMKLYDEWKDKEFVGTISYKLKDRLAWYHYTNMERLDNNIRNVSSHAHDVMPFLFYGGANLTKLNPNLGDEFKRMLDSVIPIQRDYKFVHEFNTREKEFKISPFFFFNYWMTTPARMLEYIYFFNSFWLPTLESNQNVWNNAGYVGNMTSEQLKNLTKRVDYYPYHPFINERLPASYFRYKKVRIYYGC